MLHHGIKSVLPFLRKVEIRLAAFARHEFDSLWPLADNPDQKTNRLHDVVKMRTRAAHPNIQPCSNWCAGKLHLVACWAFELNIFGSVSHDFELI